MEASNNTEKVLIQIRSEKNHLGNLEKQIIACPRMTFKNNKVYIVLGGLTDIGLELANWMIKRGAKKIILSSPLSVTNGFQGLCLHKWSKYNDVSVTVNKANLSITSEVENLFANAVRLAPVGGKMTIFV